MICLFNPWFKESKGRELWSQEKACLNVLPWQYNIIVMIHVYMRIKLAMDPLHQIHQN